MLRQKFKLVSRYKEKGKLLDIGCGTGYFPAYMRDQGWDVIGLEPDASARAIARDKLGLEVMDMAHLESLREAQFDVITMWHVLEHVHNPGATIDVIRNLLKPGGILVCAVPNYTSPDARHYGKYWAAYDVPRHLWHFAPNSMEELLKRHGFQLVRKKGMPFDAFYVSLLSEKYKSGSSGLVGGSTKGLLTNLKATGNPDSASSVIYIAQPQ